MSERTTYITGDGREFGSLADATAHANKVAAKTGAIIAVEAYRDRGNGVFEWWTAPAAALLADLITAATEAAEQLETVASQREDERQHGRAKVAHDHAEQLRAALRPYEAETGDQPHPWNATD